MPYTGVHNIRELIDHLQFAPSKATFKVIIVDEVHMLSKGAFNALLKTLEEPPQHAVFILATTEVHKVPATIISRTQRFDFKKVSIADLSKLLRFISQDTNRKITDGALLEIAAASDGSFRDGLSLLDQVMNYASGEVTEELTEQVLGLTGTRTVSSFLDLIGANQTQAAVDFIGQLLYSGRDLYQFQKDFLEYLRKLLLTKVGVSADFGFNVEFQDKIKEQAQQLSIDRITKIIENFQKAENEIKWTSIQSLPLELAAIAATQMQTDLVPIIARSEATKQPQSVEKITAPVGNGNNPLDSIIQHWPQILEKIKDYNHSLISSLKLAQPVGVENKELILLFPYKFHKDAIEARKNRIIVDQVIEEVTGVKVLVKPMLSKDWKGEVKNEKDSPLQAALKIMGGEVE